MLYIILGGNKQKFVFIIDTELYEWNFNIYFNMHTHAKFRCKLDYN